MAREDISKEIDGDLYNFKSLPATKSLKLAMKIVKLLGLPLSVTLDALTSGNGENKKEVAKQLNYIFDMGAEIDFAKIGKALIERLDQDEDQVTTMIKLALSSTHHSGSGLVSSAGVFDVHFGGRIGHLLKVFVAALECEYQDFFDLVRAKSQEGMEALSRLNQNQDQSIVAQKEENSP